jgi:hypothetical protein
MYHVVTMRTERELLESVNIFSIAGLRERERGRGREREREGERERGREREREREREGEREGGRERGREREREGEQRCLDSRNNYPTSMRLRTKENDITN